MSDADRPDGGDSSAEAARWVEDALVNARESFPDMSDGELRGPLEQAFDLATRTGRGEREFHAVFEAELRRAIEERDVVGSGNSVLPSASSMAPKPFQAVAHDLARSDESAGDDPEPSAHDPDDERARAFVADLSGAPRERQDRREPVVSVRAAELRGYRRPAPREVPPQARRRAPSVPPAEERRRHRASFMRASILDGEWLRRLGQFVLVTGLVVALVVVAIDAEGDPELDGVVDSTTASGGDLTGHASALGDALPGKPSKPSQQRSERPGRRERAAARREQRERDAKRPRQRKPDTRQSAPANPPATPSPATSQAPAAMSAPAPSATVPPAPLAPSSPPQSNSSPPSSEFGLEP